MSDFQSAERSIRASTAGPSLGVLGKLSVTALEADLAYFNARLEFIGKPITTNQKAQLTVFRLLIQFTTRILQHLRRPTSENL
jgi:hypothetical protein